MPQGPPAVRKVPVDRFVGDRCVRERLPVRGEASFGKMIPGARRVAYRAVIMLRSALFSLAIVAFGCGNAQPQASSAVAPPPPPPASPPPAAPVTDAGAEDVAPIAPEVASPAPVERTGTTWPFHSWDRAEAVAYNPFEKRHPIQLRAYDDAGWSPHIVERKALPSGAAKQAADLVASTKGDVAVSKCPFPRHAVVFFDKDVPSPASTFASSGDIWILAAVGDASGAGLETMTKKDTREFEAREHQKMKLTRSPFLVGKRCSATRSASRSTPATRPKPRFSPPKARFFRFPRGIRVATLVALKPKATLLDAASGAFTYLEFGVCLTAFLPVMACVASPPSRRSHAARPGRWMRRLGRTTGASRRSGALPWREAPRDIGERGYVVVANHESQADPFLLSWLPWDMRWVAKEELFEPPLIGWAMTWGGDIPLRRGSATSVRAMMEECERALAGGISIMMFPEGTRSKDATLLPFRDGAFELATRMKAPVLPIAIAGTRQMRPKHSKWFGKAHACAKILQPFETAGETAPHVARDRARDAIVAACPISALRYW